MCLERTRSHLSRRVSTGAFVTLLILLLGAPRAGSAQQREWDIDRPDAYAPAGVTGDRTIPEGSYEVFYRFGYTKMEGTRIQTSDAIPSDLLLQVFPSIPLTTTRTLHEVGILVAPTGWLTLMGQVGYLSNENDQLTEEASFVTTSEGVTDVEVSALVSFVNTPGIRTHFDLGVSIPVGSIDQAAVIPDEGPGELPLPYTMQIGSGTLDLRPGGTLVAQNEHGSFGAQVRGTLRLGDNDRDYAFGDRVGGTAWLAPKLTDHLSASVRFSYEIWGDVTGFDPALDPFGDQAAHPLTQGGSRMDVPVGLNFYSPHGALNSTRISTEFVFPVRHDLHGPQLGMDWGFRFSLTRMF